MYLLKNAIKNLVRNKGRNILLLIVVIAMIAASTVAILINRTSSSIIEDYKTRFGVKVNLNLDMDSMNKWDVTESGQYVTWIPVEQYLEFIKSEYLKSYQLTITMPLGLDGVKAIGWDKELNTDNGNTTKFEYPTCVSFVADANVLSMKEFEDGKRKLVDGKLYSNINECLISKDFAKLNGLKVGDTFTVVSEAKDVKKIELTVSGIYFDGTEQYKGPLQISLYNRRNEIMVSLETLQNANLPMSFMTPTASFELKSPDLIEDFTKNLRSKGLSETFKVDANTKAYERIVAPVMGLNKITNSFMWVVLAVGGAIILLVAAMAVRERKYEIAVLRSMGLKKQKVIAMLLAEMLMITTIGLAVGLGIGAVSSQPIANSMLESQIQIAEENKSDNLGGILYEDPNDTDESLSNIKVELTSGAVATVCLIALVMAILSTFMGAFFITKYEPLKLLSERN